jgi:hypothetical protein
MKFYLIIVTGILFIVPCGLGAQDAKPVIRIRSFVIEGLGPDEGQIIESLLQSYVNALGVLVPAEGDSAQASARGGREPDYTLSGRITLEQDNRVLVLEISRPRTNETAQYTSVHRTTGELVLKVRSIVESVFSGPSDPAHLRERPVETLTGGKITGTWKGDAGIEVVHLQPGGRGFAILSSGVRMDLRYSIENNILQVVQSSSNTERFYHPVPYNVARELVRAAEPMRWELALYDNGASLRGVKVATAVRYEGDRVLEFLPSTAREAEWTRSSP